jgi:thiol-disulfide isomerase/thioredoxin
LAWTLLFGGTVLRAATDVGDLATDFTLVDRATGKNIKLSDYEGHVILLDFFAWWCGPCKTSSPVVEKEVYKYFKDLGGNESKLPVVLLGINVEMADSAKTDEFVANAGMELVGNDSNYAAGNQFGVSGIPTFVVINGTANSTSHQQWEVVYRRSGFEGATALRAAVNSIKAPQPEEEEKSVNNGTNAEAGGLLKSWAWYGQFPWVYCSLDENWFYYHHSPNNFFVWRAKDQKWYRFDSTTGTWLLHGG